MVQEAIPETVVKIGINYWHFIIIISIILIVLAFIFFMLLYFRKFYKPTIGKIIVTLILAVIIEYFLFQDVAHSIVCMGCKIGQFCPPCVDYSGAWDVVKVTIIPLLFIIYSLICLIYKLFKRK